MSGIKTCNVCNTEKSLAEFYFRKDNNKYRDNCKKCKPIIGRKFWAERTSKICKDCGIDKPLTEYQKKDTAHQPYCKPCDSIRKKKCAANNVEGYQASRKRYYTDNKVEINKRGSIYQKDQKEKVNEYRRKRYQAKKHELSAYAKAARASKRIILTDEEKAAKVKAAKDRKREGKRIWCNMKSATSIEFKILKNLRGRTRFALKREGNVKSAATEELLGCTIPEFRNYFEGLFSDGMTWELFMEGKIHIDHKRPCVLFDLSFPAQQRECFNYKNLQPLFWLQNLQKGTKNFEEWQIQ
jgi:hypothetical protein